MSPWRKSRVVRARLFLFLGAVALAGCALVPPPSSEDLQKEVLQPDATPPAQWTAGHPVSGSIEDSWLTSFADPRLDALVAEAMTYNADLRAAAARVEAAAANVRVAGGALYPTVDALARGGGKMSGDNSGLSGVLVTASWEIDVWGRVRYNVRGVEEQYASTQADLEFARQSLAALVAKSWFLATESTLQLGLLNEMVDASTRLLGFAEQRRKVGIGDELDVASARVNLQTYRDNQRQVQLAREQALRALELLVGRYPAAEIETPSEFGSLASSVPAGLPSELLERRPDVIAAQKRVAVAFNRVKESEAARLPRISLTGGASAVRCSRRSIAAARSKRRSRCARPNRNRPWRNT